MSTPAAAEAVLRERFFHIWDAYARRDLATITAACAPEVTFCGTGAREEAFGLDAFVALNVKEFAQVPEPFTYDVLRWQASAAGTVAWIETKVVVRLAVGGAVVETPPLRMTWIMAWREGAWLLVHLHASSPLAEQQEDESWPAEALLAENRALEEKVAARTAELQRSLEELRRTQAQLIQQEKLASLGQLTAGIAHEIKNPLNFVNNFAQLAVELADELANEAGAEPAKRLADATGPLSDLKVLAEKIVRHGRRADGIVQGMLDHSRTARGERQPTDINALLEDYLALSWHGLRAQRPGFDVRLDRVFDPALGLVEVVPQDLGRVFINLLSNAFFAVQERARREAGPYAATVTVSTHGEEDAVVLRIADNGTGIPDRLKERIFEPFFTTKPAGQGTGLGLSLSREIVVQGHGGTLTVESEEGEGSAFIISLPRRIGP